MTVTTMRLWSSTITQDGGELLSTVPLDKIDGISLYRYEQQAWLVMSIVCGTFGGMAALIGMVEQRSSVLSTVGLVIGGLMLVFFVVFLIAYILSRRIMVTIYAGALSMSAQVSASQADHSEARAFIYQTEGVMLRFRGKV